MELVIPNLQIPYQAIKSRGTEQEIHLSPSLTVTQSANRPSIQPRKNSHNHGRSIHKNLQVNRINKIGPATGPQQNLQNEQNERNLQEFERSDMEKRKQMGTFKGNVWIIRIWTFMTSHVTIQSIYNRYCNFASRINKYCCCCCCCHETLGYT